MVAPRSEAERGEPVQEEPLACEAGGRYLVQLYRPLIPRDKASVRNQEQHDSRFLFEEELRARLRIAS